MEDREKSWWFTPGVAPYFVDLAGWELGSLQVVFVSDGGVAQGLGGGVRPARLVRPRTRQVVEARDRQRGSKCCLPQLGLPP